MSSIRGEIHMNELIRFKDWLFTEGWLSEPTRGIYEMLRVRNDNDELMIFYKREKSAHLSCSLESRYIYWISKYRLDMRRQKRKVV